MERNHTHYLTPTHINPPTKNGVKKSAYDALRALLFEPPGNSGGEL